MLALALLLTSAASDPLCARALRAAPDLSCAAAGHGVALASTPDEAERLAGYARAGEARFAERLGRDLAPYVVANLGSRPVADIRVILQDRAKTARRYLARQTFRTELVLVAFIAPWMVYIIRAVQADPDAFINGFFWGGTRGADLAFRVGLSPHCGRLVHHLLLGHDLYLSAVKLPSLRRRRAVASRSRRKVEDQPSR